MFSVVLVACSLLDFQCPEFLLCTKFCCKDTSQDNESLLMCPDLFYSDLRNVFNSSDFFFPLKCCSQTGYNSVHISVCSPSALSLSPLPIWLWRIPWKNQVSRLSNHTANKKNINFYFISLIWLSLSQPGFFGPVIWFLSAWDWQYC